MSLAPLSAEAVARIRVDGTYLFNQFDQKPTDQRAAALLAHIEQYRMLVAEGRIVLPRVLRSPEACR